MFTKKIRHLNKYYDLITDDNFENFNFRVQRQTSGKLFVSIIIDKEQINFAKYLYGYSVTHINGNYFDFRKKNCKRFDMAEYNRNKRNYTTAKEMRGIVKRLCGYSFRVYKDNKLFVSDEIYDTLEKAIAERKKKQSELGIIL